MEIRSRRKQRGSPRAFLLLLLVCGIPATFFFFLTTLRSFDSPDEPKFVADGGEMPVRDEASHGSSGLLAVEEEGSSRRSPPPCATVEEMGEVFRTGSMKESLRVRNLIREHFDLHGAAKVRELPPEQFCQQGFVIGKASEAGFGNEMYKILTAAALSVMLNRGKFPFGEHIRYTNLSFTLKEVKHLWRKNNCIDDYRRKLVMRIDDFKEPAATNVLCSDWISWKQAIVWFEGATDAVASQFFLKNIHPRVKNAASNLFGNPTSLESRPNVFGELMRVVISPSEIVEEAIRWVLNGGPDPYITLHMRMMTSRSEMAMHAALKCIQKALQTYQHESAKPRVVIVSDTPSFFRDISPNLMKFAEVLHFNYEQFQRSISNRSMIQKQQPDFRVKDWGPAPRWVAFVDFFLASRAKHAVISGAHRRVGTTYAQLIAALAAANQLSEESSSTASSFSFFSSFQSNLLEDGLGKQAGWGHVWNRFAGPLSCRNQVHQCAFTPLLPPAWWDGNWQSPISRDIKRLQAYGVHLTDTGKVINGSLQSFCNSRKEFIRVIRVIDKCMGRKCT